jgi:hypothetical protein
MIVRKKDGRVRLFTRRGYARLSDPEDLRDRRDHSAGPLRSPKDPAQRSRAPQAPDSTDRSARKAAHFGGQPPRIPEVAVDADRCREPSLSGRAHCF